MVSGFRGRRIEWRCFQLVQIQQECEEVSNIITLLRFPSSAFSGSSLSFGTFGLLEIGGVSDKHALILFTRPDSVHSDFGAI